MALNIQLAAFFFPVYAVVVLGLVISGTYALFKSFSVFALQRLRRNQQHYYRGMNLISTSNLLYRIKSNATILATIAVLSATTLTAVGMSYSFYFAWAENLKESSPFSYVYLVGGAMMIVRWTDPGPSTQTRCWPMSGCPIWRLKARWLAGKAISTRLSLFPRARIGSY